MQDKDLLKNPWEKVVLSSWHLKLFLLLLQILLLLLMLFLLFAPTLDTCTVNSLHVQYQRVTNKVLAS